MIIKSPYILAKRMANWLWVLLAIVVFMALGMGAAEKQRSMRTGRISGEGNKHLWPAERPGH